MNPTGPEPSMPRSWVADAGVQGFVFEVPAVRSKSNFRRGDARAAAAWVAEQQFRVQVEVLARAARPQDWETGLPGTPLSLRPVVVACVVARTLLDSANLSKSVLDACEGVVYINDASVAGCATFAERSSSSQLGLVGFCRLAPRSSLAEVVESSHRLAVATLGFWQLH